MRTFVIAVLLFLGWCFPTSCKEDRKIIASGTFSKVEYLQGNFGASARTVVTMKDGSTYALLHFVSVPFPQGTKIVIVETSYGTEIREDQ